MPAEDVRQVQALLPAYQLLAAASLLLLFVLAVAVIRAVGRVVQARHAAKGADRRTEVRDVWSEHKLPPDWDE